MKSMHVHIRPYRPSTNSRVDVYIAAGRDPSTFGVADLNWNAAFSRQPEKTIELFDLTLSGKFQVPQLRFEIMVDQLVHVADAAELHWKGSPVFFYSVDDLNWSTRTIEFAGRISSAPYSNDRRKIGIEAQGSLDRVTKPLLTASFDGSGGLGGEPEKRDLLKPAGWGEVENLSPVFFDETRNMAMLDGYGNLQQIHAVFEGLNPFTSFAGDYANIAALTAAYDAGTILAGQWASSIADGIIVFGAPPVGEITCHARFGLNRPGAIMKSWLLDRADLDPLVVAESDFDDLDAAMPYDVRFWTDQQQDIKTLMEQMCATVLATPIIRPDNQIGITSIIGGAPAAVLDKSGAQLPRVIASRQAEQFTPTYKTAARAARPAVVLRRDQVNFADDFVPMGVFKLTDEYRLGNTVFGPDKAEWLYINETPALGAAAPLPVWPVESNAYWQNLQPPVQLEFVVGNLDDIPDGTARAAVPPTERDKLFTVENYATRGAPVGSLIAGTPAEAIVADVANNKGAVAGLQEDAAELFATTTNIASDVAEAQADITDLFTVYGDTASAAISASNAAISAADAAAAVTSAAAQASASQAARLASESARDASIAARDVSQTAAGNAQAAQSLADTARAQAQAAQSAAAASQAAAAQEAAAALLQAQSAAGSAGTAAGHAATANTRADQAASSASSASASALFARSRSGQNLVAQPVFDNLQNLYWMGSTNFWTGNPPSTKGYSAAIRSLQRDLPGADLIPGSWRAHKIRIVAEMWTNETDYKGTLGFAIYYPNGTNGWIFLNYRPARVNYWHVIDEVLTLPDVEITAIRPWIMQETFDPPVTPAAALSLLVTEFFAYDVTESTLASGFADASAISATNAQSSATAAGNSASASQTSRLASEAASAASASSATAASSARDEAVGSASTAAGHASTAASQASLATSARDAAAGSASAANTSKNEAATFAGQAGTFASAANTSSLTASTAKDAAVKAAARTFISDFENDFEFWEWRENSPGYYNFYTGGFGLPGKTLRYGFDGPAYVVLSAKHTVPSAPNRRWYASVPMGVFTPDWNKPNSYAYLRAISRSGLVYSGARRYWGTANEYNQFPVLEFVTSDNSDFWLQLIVHRDSDPGTLEIHVYALSMADITEQAAAAGSASAASQSAANAAASETVAGQQAAAATTAANTATTRAGEASTSAGQAATSASNAAGSASTATSQASLAASARDAAQAAQGAAAGSASAANTSAGSASASQQAAASSAAAAQSSQLLAEAARDNTRDLFQRDWPGSFTPEGRLAYGGSIPHGAGAWESGHGGQDPYAWHNYPNDNTDARFPNFIKTQPRRIGRRYRATTNFWHNCPAIIRFQVYAISSAEVDGGGTNQYQSSIIAGSTVDGPAGGIWTPLVGEFQLDASWLNHWRPAIEVRRMDGQAFQCDWYVTGIVVEDITATHESALNAAASLSSAQSATASQSAAGASAAAAQASRLAAEAANGSAQSAASSASSSASSASSSAASAQSNASLSARFADQAGRLSTGNLVRQPTFEANNTLGWEGTGNNNLWGPGNISPRGYANGMWIRNRDNVVYANNVSPLRQDWAGRTIRVNCEAYNGDNAYPLRAGCFCLDANNGVVPGGYQAITIANAGNGWVYGDGFITIPAGTVQINPWLQIDAVPGSPNMLALVTYFALFDVTERKAAESFASAASGSATSADASASSAASNASLSATYRDQAAGSASGAAGSASSAATSASAASGSAAAASGSASSAASSANLAATYRDQAAGSAGASSSSAGASAGSAATAGTHAANALASANLTARYVRESSAFATGNLVRQPTFEANDTLGWEGTSGNNLWGPGNVSPRGYANGMWIRSRDNLTYPFQQGIAGNWGGRKIRVDAEVYNGNCDFPIKAGFMGFTANGTPRYQVVTIANGRDGWVYGGGILTVESDVVRLNPWLQIENFVAPSTGANVLETLITFFSLKDITESQEAANQASIASSQQAIATAAASAAQASAVLSASFGAGANNLIQASDFTHGSIGWFTYQNYNTGTFSKDMAGAGWSIANEPNLGMFQPDGNTDHGMIWISEDFPVVVGDWLYQSCWAAGHRCNVGSYLEFYDANGTWLESPGRGAFDIVPAYGGNLISQWSRISSKCQVPGGAVRARWSFYKYATYAGQGNSYAWFCRPQVAVVPAQAAAPPPFQHGSQRATVAQHTGAIATMEGAVAFLEQIVAASGGDPAVFRMLAGKNGSAISLAANRLVLQNYVNGEIVDVARFQNGQAQFNDAMIRRLQVLARSNASIYLPVMLRPIIRLGSDGQVVQYQNGNTFGALPEKITPDLNGLPALAAGESYDIRAVNVTPTQFQVYAKKLVAAEPVTQNTGAGANTGGVPQWRADKPTALDAYNGNYQYTFQIIGQLVDSEPAPGGGGYYWYQATGNLYATDTGGNWQVIGSYNEFWGGFNASGTRWHTQSASSSMAIGQNGGYEFGVHPTQGAVSAFDGVIYATQVQSSVNPVGGAISWTITPPAPD